jgi:energy-coupling factor transport system substrate-specific component
LFYIKSPFIIKIPRGGGFRWNLSETYSLNLIRIMPAQGKDMKNIIESFKSLTIFEIVLTLVLAVALGVSLWGWTFVYDLFKPFLKIYGLQYLTAGFWIFVSIFVSFIVRKPGIAIIASVMAAFVESLLTRWGLISVLWGISQGLGAEIIFFCFSYKKWNLHVLILAAILSSIFSYGLSYIFYDYASLSLAINITQLTTFIFSSTILAGLLSYNVGLRLKRLGLLEQFLISADENN